MVKCRKRICYVLFGKLIKEINFTMLSHRNNLLKSYAEQFDENEDTALRFKSMLMVLSLLSRKHFPIDRDGKLFSNYCRAAVWVKHKGKNHLLLTSSMNVGTTAKHAEELVIKTLFSLYGQNNDKRDYQILPVSGSAVRSINIHRMFLDIEPCDGIRFGVGHHCAKFFAENGKNIQIDGQFKRVKFNGITYWNAPIPPQDTGTNARSNNIHLDLAKLDLHMKKFSLDEISAMWEECLVVDSSCIASDGHIKPLKIDFAEIFPPALQIIKGKSYESIEALLSRLIKDEEKTIQVSNKVITFLKNMDSKSQDREIFISAIVGEWTLIRVLKAGLTSKHREVTREICEAITLAKKHSQPTLHVSQSLFKPDSSISTNTSKKRLREEKSEKIMANAEFMVSSMRETVLVSSDGVASVTMKHLTEKDYACIVGELPELFGPGVVVTTHLLYNGRAIFAFANRDYAKMFVDLFEEIKLKIQLENPNVEAPAYN
jgi:hypothetical protein